MLTLLKDRRGAGLVCGLLLVQIATLWWSMDKAPDISIFCTGPATSIIGTFFGILHMFLGFLLLVGLLSFHFVRLRIPYLVFLIILMAALPVQSMLVSHGTLSCDAP